MANKKGCCIKSAYSSLDEAYVNLAAEIYLRGLHEHDERFLQSDWGKYLKEQVITHAERQTNFSSIHKFNPSHWTNCPKE